MSALIKWLFNLVQQFVIKIIRQGPIPNHIAFIMDGNRRFAKKKNIKKTEGHKAGYSKLMQIIDLSTTIGIKEITVYAFSIENFKRSEEEVNNFLDLLRETVNDLILNNKNFKSVKYNIIGNLILFPKDIQSSLIKLMKLTEDNKYLVNVALAYTSTEELTTCIKSAVMGISNNDIDANDLKIDMLSQLLYTKNSSKPDIIIRTSGERRFSDFLLWQSVNTNVYFLNVMWPELSWYHLFYILIMYQRSDKCTLMESTDSLNERSKIFTEKVYECRIQNFTN